MRFQSTLPVRGATAAFDGLRHALPISIHAPREGSDRCAFQVRQRLIISIHAPREGSDPSASLQFTLRDENISIHAPREGSDPLRPGNRAAPHIFQSTLPVRGATPRTGRCRRRLRYFNPRSP